MNQFIRQYGHFLFPAVLLNPILILHTINGFLTLINLKSSQEFTYDTFFQTYLDVNANENFGLGYTVVMICAQFRAYQHCFKVTDATVERDAHKQIKGDGYW